MWSWPCHASQHRFVLFRFGYFHFSFSRSPFFLLIDNLICGCVCALASISLRISLLLFFIIHLFCSCFAYSVCILKCSFNFYSTVPKNYTYGLVCVCTAFFSSCFAQLKMFIWIWNQFIAHILYDTYTCSRCVNTHNNKICECINYYAKPTRNSIVRHTMNNLRNKNRTEWDSLEWTNEQNKWSERKKKTVDKSKFLIIARMKNVFFRRPKSPSKCNKLDIYKTWTNFIYTACASHVGDRIWANCVCSFQYRCELLLSLRFCFVCVYSIIRLKSISSLVYDFLIDKIATRSEKSA